MKRSFLSLALAGLMTIPVVYGQEKQLGPMQVKTQSGEVLTLGQRDIDAVSAKLLQEAENKQHSKKTRRMLKKVAAEMQSFDAQALVGESLSEESQAAEVSANVSVAEGEPVCVNANEEAQPKVTLPKIGRALGKGATWLSVQTMKPFMKVSSFLTGFFEKPDKNQDVVALYQLFLNNKSQFAELYKDAGTPEEFIELVMLEFERIAQRKSQIILRDVLKRLFPGQVIPVNVEDIDPSQFDFSSVDLQNFDLAFINEHPEFKDLKPLVGEISREQFIEMVETAYVDISVDFNVFERALPKVHELAGTLVGQVVAPTVVLSAISGTLGGLYAIPVAIADVGAGISAGVCLSKKTQEKFDADQDLRAFCSYVTNWSGYQLMKSRAQGYVAGKNAKAKLKAWQKKRKEKREERRRLRRERNA